MNLESTIEKIGDVILELRKSRGLSQQELANLAGTSQMSIQRAESGTSGMKVETLVSISAALEVNLVDIFEEITDGSKNIPRKSGKWTATANKVNKLSLADRNWISDLVEKLLEKFS